MDRKYLELQKIYTSFLKIPFENVSAYYKGGPIDFNEIPENIKNKLGGSCFPLSLYTNEKLNEMGFKSRIFYFDLNRFFINDTIKIEKLIDLKYHTAIAVSKNDKNININNFYMLDLGLQFEKVLDLDFRTKKNLEFKLKTKTLNIINIDKGKYCLDIVSGGKKEKPLYFDLNFKPSPEDIKRHLENNYFRLVPLKYSVLKEDGFKHSLKITKEGFYIKKANNKEKSLIKLNSLEDVANYFNISYVVLKKAYENWYELLGEKYFSLN
jgi:hypothetical protein